MATAYPNWWTNVVLQGLSQLAEGLDSLERGYLLAREEHKRLQQQQGAKISHFDPERWEWCPTSIPHIYILYTHTFHTCFLLFFFHGCTYMCIYQRAGGANLPMWTSYGRTERAGGRDATGAAHVWGSSNSTSSSHPVFCPLWGGRNSDSPTGTTTMLYMPELCSK